MMSNFSRSYYLYKLIYFEWKFICYFYILACMFPLGAWFFKLVDHFSLLLSCICSTSIMLSVYVLFLTIQQIFLVLKCQTWYEYNKNINLFDVRRKLKTNLKLVFGKQWYIIIFSPLVSSKPVGDGMSFDMNRIPINNIQYNDGKRI